MVPSVFGRGGIVSFVVVVVIVEERGTLSPVAVVVVGVVGVEDLKTVRLISSCLIRFSSKCRWYSWYSLSAAISPFSRVLSSFSWWNFFLYSTSS